MRKWVEPVAGAVAGAGLAVGLLAATGGSAADVDMLGLDGPAVAACASLADGAPYTVVADTLNDDPTVSGKVLSRLIGENCPTVDINWSPAVTNGPTGELLATGDYRGGMFGPGVEEDSPVVAVLLTVRGIIYGN